MLGVVGLDIALLCPVNQEDRIRTGQELVIEYEKSRDIFSTKSTVEAD